MERSTAAGSVMQLTKKLSPRLLPLGVAAVFAAPCASHAQLARATYVTEGSFQLPARGQPGGLEQPVAIAVGPDGMIHIAGERGPVQVYDAQGSPTHRYGQGQLEKPAAIAIAREGYVFVLDRDRKQVFVYDPEGQPLRAISRRGNRGGELADPIDLAVDPAGYVYVLDKGRGASKSSVGTARSYATSLSVRASGIPFRWP